VSDEIEYALDDGVAIVTINRPQKRNAMTYATLAAFHRAVLRAADEPEARAVVITGAQPRGAGDLLCLRGPS
jgi:enoyl-CoA hydratase/carnithine racemase